MRLWHKNLIPVLPRQQLVSQYREDNSIMKAIAENNTPNHILVNRIMDYPIIHFALYHFLVVAEMKKRGYQVRKDGIERFNNNYAKLTERTFEEDDRTTIKTTIIAILLDCCCLPRKLSKNPLCRPRRERKTYIYTQRWQNKVIW